MFRFIQDVIIGMTKVFGNLAGGSGVVLLLLSIIIFCRCAFMIILLISEKKYKNENNEKLLNRLKKSSKLVKFTVMIQEVLLITVIGLVFYNVLTPLLPVVETSTSKLKSEHFYKIISLMVAMLFSGIHYIIMMDTSVYKVNRKNTRKYKKLSDEDLNFELRVMGYKQFNYTKNIVNHTSIRTYDQQLTIKLNLHFLMLELSKDTFYSERSIWLLQNVKRNLGVEIYNKLVDQMEEQYPYFVVKTKNSETHTTGINERNQLISKVEIEQEEVSWCFDDKKISEVLGNDKPYKPYKELSIRDRICNH